MLTKLRRHLFPQEQVQYAEEQPEKPATSTERVYKPRIDLKNELLDLLKGWEGKPIRLRELSDMLGYGSTTSVLNALNSLRKSGAITRKRVPGNHGAFSYVVKRSRVNQRRQTTAPRSPRQESDVDSPKVGELGKKVLGYLGRHQDALITGEKIAHDTGLKPAAVHYQIKVLVQKGLVERSGPTREGTRYRVVGESTADRTADQGPNLETQAEPVTDTPSTFVRVMDNYIWEYVTTHWDTNLMKFRQWMAQQFKG